MPAFANNPFQKPPLLQKGVPTYLIGSFSQQVGNTNASVKTNAIATNVATVVCYYLNGPLPIAGSLVSIQGSANASGLFNVNRVALTSASLDATQTPNLLTLVFPLTGSNQTATADAGTVIVEPAEVGETVSGNYTSIACIAQSPECDSQFTAPFCFAAAAGVTAAVATLQVAINADASEWSDTTTVVTKTGASSYSAGPVVQATLQRGYAYRANVTGVTGSGLAVCKIGG